MKRLLIPLVNDCIKNFKADKIVEVERKGKCSRKTMFTMHIN
jgi:hypothetical protein